MEKKYLTRKRESIQGSDKIKRKIANMTQNKNLSCLLFNNVNEFLSKNEHYIHIGTEKNPDEEVEMKTQAFADFGSNEIRVWVQDDDTIILEYEKFYVDEYELLDIKIDGLLKPMSYSHFEERAKLGYNVKRNPDSKYFDSMGYHKSYLTQLLDDAEEEFEQKDVEALAGTYDSILKVVEYLQKADRINKLEQELRAIV